MECHFSLSLNVSFPVSPTSRDLFIKIVEVFSMVIDFVLHISCPNAVTTLRNELLQGGTKISSSRI